MLAHRRFTSFRFHSLVEFVQSALGILGLLHIGQPGRSRALSIQPNNYPENFEMRTNGTDISRQNFQKIKKLVEFPKREAFNLKILLIKIKWNGKFQVRNFRKFGCS